ncbi:MAG: phage major capsid protein, partial [Chloroflexi bacterium]|nr:phage major capsid protein [Chloroflexota bacterium]
MTAKELREKRAPLAKRIKELADKAKAEKRDFNDAEKAEWDRINPEYDGLTQEIARAERDERAESVAKEQTERASALPPPGREDVDTRKEERGESPTGSRAEQRAIALQAWFREQAGMDLTEDHRRACESVGLNPRQKELSLRLVRNYAAVQAAFRDGGLRGAESRALSAITAADGGAITSPESMVQQLEVNMLAYGGVLQAAQVIRTAGRERMRWPTVNDTSNKGRRLGESGVVTSTAQPTFAGVYWDSYKYTSDEILVPYELLVGTPFDLPSILGALMGERIGRKLADDFTTGTGANQPKGIVTAATTFAA